MNKIGIFTKDIKLGTSLSERLVNYNRKFLLLDKLEELDDSFRVAIIDLNEKDFRDESFIKGVSTNQNIYVIGIAKKVVKNENDHFKNLGCNMMISSVGIIRNISSILNLGVDKISLCDTSGMATPDTTSRLLESVFNFFPRINICLHLHNTYGYGLKNLCCALQFGIKEIDTSLGGIGGTPYLKSSKGNIATEDTVSMLEKMGYHTGIDYKKVSEQSRFLQKIIGEKYFSGEMYKKSKSY